MTTEKIVGSFTSAAKEYFGLKEGETLREFLAECQALSQEDKQELTVGMERHGIKIASKT